MPHLTIEVTKNINLDPSKFIYELNTTLIASKEFSENDVKTRLYYVENYYTGLTSDNGFIHCRLEIMAGRTPATKSSLLRSISNKIKRMMTSSCSEVQISVNIIEINPHHYFKNTISFEKL